MTFAEWSNPPAPADPPWPIRRWASEACDGSPQAYRELEAGLDSEHAEQWLGDLATWAVETGAPSLALSRLRAGLKAGGMAPSTSVAVVAEIRRRARDEAGTMRYLARREADAHRSPPAQARLASLALRTLRSRPDAGRLVVRGGYVYAPPDMARAVFAGLGADSAELVRWRDAGLLKCDAGGFTTRIRLGQYDRPRVYALRCDLDMAPARAGDDGPAEP